MNLSIDTSMVKNYASYQVQTDTKKEESEKTAKANQDDYTAVSSQGDTLQISEAGASAWQDSSEEQSEDTSQDQTNIAKLVSEAVDTEDSSTSTQDLSGYSESELKEMYEDGEITKAEYDAELESRKSADEE